MQTEKKITVPFTVRHDEETGFSFIVEDVPNVTGVYKGSLASAASALREQLGKAIEQAIETEKNHHKLAVLQCGDGTVLTVRFSLGSWGYDISGPDRKYGPSGQSGGADTFEQSVARAREHAAQCYGGISWECGSPAKAEKVAS